MIQLRDGSGFALEPLRELLLRNLDSDFAAKASIRGAIHFTHPALAQLGGDAIVPDDFADHFPYRRAPPQFVEEVQQEGHMDIPLLLRWRFKLREYCKPLAVRRKVVVRISAEVVKLLIGPHARLAGYESVCCRRIILHHDAVARILEEKLPTGARPDR